MYYTDSTTPLYNKPVGIKQRPCFMCNGSGFTGSSDPNAYGCCTCHSCNGTGVWTVHILEPVGCLWDLIPERDKRKPMMLSCPCPKCTPSF